MENTKVLFVSQEITPYLPESEMSVMGRELPQGVQERGKEIRTFMPRYGCINERRNQLHEVIRLSGMNLIIDDTDHPLIIKVASIQAARMQVYFIDNEDYFQRKAILSDGEGKYFDDNDERAIFFARGVLETVKKLRWSPDIIHCQGWFTGIVPLLIKTLFADDPTFINSKVVFSLFDNTFTNKFDNTLKSKLSLSGFDTSSIDKHNVLDYRSFNKIAIDYSDGIIYANRNIDADLKLYVDQSEKPVLDHQDPEIYMDAYSEFYDQLASVNVNV